MKRIKLTQDKFVLVDDEVFDYLSQWKWYFDGSYATRNSTYIRGLRRGRVRMHRVITSCLGQDEVDHINGDRLDNRRINLRIVTPEQNRRNRKLNKNNKSGFKGVCFVKRLNGWVAYCQNKHIGTFKDPVLAAQAYNQVAIKSFGQYAKLNNIDNLIEKGYTKSQ